MCRPLTEAQKDHKNLISWIRNRGTILKKVHELAQDDVEVYLLVLFRGQAHEYKANDRENLPPSEQELTFPLPIRWTKETYRPAAADDADDFEDANDTNGAICNDIQKKKMAASAHSKMRRRGFGGRGVYMYSSDATLLASVVADLRNVWPTIPVYTIARAHVSAKYKVVVL